MDNGPTDDAKHPIASQAWCEQGRLLTADLPPMPGLGWRVQFDVADESGQHERWYQVVEDGRVVAWQQGDVDSPDLELRWSRADAAAVFRQELDGTEALAAARVLVPGGSEGVAPPLDMRDTAEMALLPEVPGATVVTQFEFSGGPFGHISFWESFEDGRCTELDFGRHAEPDVTIAISFQRMVHVRTGAMTILEALENGGRVDGALGPIMLTAGLEESPELRAVERACGPAGAVLAKVGEVAATPAYAEAMTSLAQLTS
ncbi:MAG: hypothetical protein M3Z46_03700 [Actinomycetota bacterium]|nr:hypothetical protein [Actinomycetota bacterium]